jgi:uncharacterized protein
MSSANLVEPPAPEVPAPARYCNQCGGARDAETGECPACANLGGQIPAAARPAEEQYRLDIGSVRSALWLYFTLLGLSAVFVVWQRVNGGTPSAMTEFVTSGAFSVAVLCWCGRALSLVVPPLKERFHVGWILFAFCAGFPTYLLASGAVDLLVRLGVEEVEYLTAFSNAGYGFGWAVLVVCAQPAIFEEIAFRGVVQGSLGRVLGEREALIVSALMFGILHLSIPSLPHLLALGLVLGWLRLRTKSLIPGMVLHFTHNFLVIVSEQNGGLLLW